MLPRFHYVRDGLIINLNHVIFAHERRKHYESYPDNESCAAHILANETFRVDVGGGEGREYQVQSFHLSPQEAAAFTEAVLKYKRELVDKENN